MSVKTTQAYFNSSTGVNKIRTLIWAREEGEIKGVFQIAHGVSEHIERYDDFARFLAERGFVVVGNDHLGHGLSVNSADEYGFFAQERGDLRLVDDMHLLHNIMVKRYPGVPYFLFGHSMGSFCARNYAADFGEELSGLILCGTGELPTAAILGEKPMAFLADKMKAGSKLDLLGFMGKFIAGKGGDSLSWLSYNEENIARYREDPMCGIPLTVAGTRDALAMMNKACMPNWADKLPKDLPILLISGAKDPVGFNGAAVINVCDNLEDAGITAEVILYPGMRHEILNEEEHEKVYNDIYAFLLKALA